jgi:hypothetical protein
MFCGHDKLTIIKFVLVLNKWVKHPSKLASPKQVMKTLLTPFAIIAFALLGASPKAEARHFESHVYISGHRSCGTPIYTERYFIGYDCWGRPLWGTRVVRHHYRPVVRHVAPYPIHYPHPRVRYDRCDTRPHSRTNIVIQGSFRR